MSKERSSGRVWLGRTRPPFVFFITKNYGRRFPDQELVKLSRNVIVYGHDVLALKAKIRFDCSSTAFTFAPRIDSKSSSIHLKPRIHRVIVLQ